MKKFWRSGMIDKKVIIEREREEYINKLQRTILELSKPDIGDLINDTEPFSSLSLTDIKDTTDYDEVRIGDNVILDFGGERIICAPKERLKDNIRDTYSRWLKNRKPYDSDIKFDNNTFGKIEDKGEY